MSAHSLGPDELISRLSHRPRHLDRAMITIHHPSKPPQCILAHRVSSLGTLSRLPPEIMSILLGMLDVQSIALFSCVSFHGNTFVRAQRAYRDLITFAPRALLALGKTGLASVHPVAKLQAVLRSDECASCNKYGAFLFLPTCERCCWECLRYNPSLRMIPPQDASRFFGLLARHRQQLSVLHVIPGQYSIAAIPAPENCKLLSAKHARDMGLAVHGSAEKIALAMARKCRSINRLRGQFFQGDPAEFQGKDSLLLPNQGNIPTDEFFGMASLPFPSLSKSGEVEDGLWCRGCKFTLDRYDSLRLPQDAVAAVVPSDCGPQRVLLGLERRAWSKEAFLHHIKHCYGARQLVPELATGDN
ncbi:F-box domain-containing protein [Xylariaceae sp. FL0804]|nr:F-box domain-containing protein [Xylariaceae sp. FL0804]